MCAVLLALLIREWVLTADSIVRPERYIRMATCEPVHPRWWDLSIEARYRLADECVARHAYEWEIRPKK